MPDTPPLTPADPAALTQAIHYALRFNERGKPLAKGIRDDPEQMAAWIAQHLARANYVILQGPTRQPHTAGGEGRGRNDGRAG